DAKPDGRADRDALAMLRQWNFDANGDSPASAIFQAWFHELAPAVAGDDLPPLALDAYAGRFTYVTRFAIRTLTANDASWCDDRRTTTKETCDDTVTAALHNAVTDLTQRMGGDLRSWRWDRLHKAVFPHQGLDSVGALRPLLSRSVPNGRDWSTVN